MQFIRHFHEIGPGDVEIVGGKGLSLGLLAQASLPVPPGFCLTVTAHRHAREQEAAAGGLPVPLVRELCDAYRSLGSGMVAVRSSATTEDGQAASFAGQQETILGVQGEDAVLDAVKRCWASLEGERARAYRQKQGVGATEAAMAVVVQRLIPSEVSGVLFTRDPLDPSGKQMLVEAAWGLGESVVSGRVQPDRYHLSRDSGVTLEAHICEKRHRITPSGVEEIPPDQRSRPCLDADQLQRLAMLGRSIEEYYSAPRDVEWAWAEGQFWVLQARPITTAGAYERELLRQQEIASLQARAEPRGTVWSKYNLAEILPTPTPMTWGLVSRFMSGQGGYGLMLRDLGFAPDPIVDREGFIDLVCGRPYVNLSREPRLYFHDFPSGHSFAALKANPARAFYPQAAPDRERITARFLFRLPVIFYQMLRNYSLMNRQRRMWAEHLRKEVYPRFAAAVADERETDLGARSSEEVLKHFRLWVERTLNTFARESLRPSVFAALAMANLEQGVKRTIGLEAAAAAVRDALSGVHPDPEADLPAALQELIEGRMAEAEFIRWFGHRGLREMELAEPRWSEAPERLPRSQGQHVLHHHTLAPAVRWQRFIDACKLDAAQAKLLEPEFESAQTYMGLRETSKHFLMMGYALIRRCLLELDRRHGLQGGIFYLVPEELPELLAGKDLRPVIHERRQRRHLLLTLEVPPVLFSDDLEAIGRPLSTASGADLKGTPLAAGVAEGLALVLDEPQPAEHVADGYILVCPSTDPAWVPLFLRAGGLVMETGGVLSHGAIVAREFGLPAVAGIANVHRRITTGQRLRVDGNTGAVHVGD